MDKEIPFIVSHRCVLDDISNVIDCKIACELTENQMTDEAVKMFVEDIINQKIERGTDD